MSEQFNGIVDIRDSANNTTISLDGNSGDLGVWREISGVRKQVLQFDAEDAMLHIGSVGNKGRLIVNDGAGQAVLHFDSQYAALYVGGVGNEGDIIVRDEMGVTRIRVDGQSGDIKLTGADCAEEFDIVEEIGSKGGALYHCWCTSPPSALRTGRATHRCIRLASEVHSN